MSLRARLHDQEPEHHDRWLISYADFITLLFAFFVVMYAVSSVNDGKYRVLSDSLETAFSDPQARLLPIDLGGGMPYGAGGEHPDVEGAALILGAAASALEEAGLEGEPVARPAGTMAFEVIEVANARAASELVQRRLAAAIDDSRFAVRQGEDWLEIELQSEFLFDSGSARLQSGADAVLAAVAPVLAALPGSVRVEGYTDNLPIASARYPSNWELSAARAGSIVRFFERQGVDPSRLAAVGRGEHQPVAGNDTAEGRRRNRRVVIAVAAAPGSELEREAEAQQAARAGAAQANPPAEKTQGPDPVLKRVTAPPLPFTVR